MGWGDVKMAGLIGLMVGYPRIFVAVLGSVILGGLVAIFLLITKKKGRKEGIPFGPFLSLAAMVALVWGQPILNWYLHFYRI
jgi:leader peptidase (prepilin peptidase)/N-methyltransferase